MTLSIIIVNYRSWNHLANCLDALQEQGTSRFEIVVVDNDSADGQLEPFIDRFPAVTFVPNSRNAGFASACNLGARHAKGPLLLFMNPDVIASPASVQALLEEKERHPEISILTAQQIDSRGKIRKVFDVFPDLLTYLKTVKALLRLLRPSRFRNPRQRFDRIVDCDWISGSLVLISREDFSRLGGWCEDFWMYSEDVDLCRRARSMGLRVAMTPAAEFVHVHGGASRRDPRTARLTKLETIISKHVYNQRHNRDRGIHRRLNDGIIAAKHLLPLFLGSVGSWILLRQSARLNLSGGIFVDLVRYYGRALTTGNWLSSRLVTPVTS